MCKDIVDPMFTPCEEMGVCLSIDQEERKARARSDEIDRRLQTSGHEEDHVIKILLLGKLTQSWHVESLNDIVVVIVCVASLAKMALLV